MGHRLGQCFLKDNDVLANVASALEPLPDTVIEIGPGHGELTRLILEKSPKKLILIEKDPALVKKLKEGLSKGKDNIEVIEGDALLVLPEIIASRSFDHPYAICGNIPYYITGHLFRIIGDLPRLPEKCVFTVQKEVAERILPENGMNILSASIAFWASAEITQIIPAECFSPKPKVDSATVRLVSHQSIDIPKEKYYAAIKAIFRQPRKTLLNNLISLDIPKDILLHVLSWLDIPENIRPEHLSVKNITDIIKALP
jgi:16S rRNA (adenine1518-N6/adenine1519-N6)-dimethyltransferase